MRLKNYSKRIQQIPDEVRKKAKEYFDMKDEKLKQLQEKAKERHTNVSIDTPVYRPELFDEKVARIKAVAERVNKAIGLCYDCGKDDCHCGFGE